MAFSKEQVATYKREADQVVQSRKGVFDYRCMGVDGIIFFVKKLIPGQERESIMQEASHFTRVYFIQGIDESAIRDSSSLANRALYYGLALPGWRMSRGNGEWESF